MEQRYDAVMEVVRDGRTVVEVAARYGVSRQSVHGWIGRYRYGGIEALADRSSRPRHCPHQMPPEVEAAVVAARLAHPRWGAKTVAHHLARAGVDPVPSESGIYRALRRAGLIDYRPRPRKPRDYRRWERDRAMELWQLDVVGGVMLTDGTELKAVTGVDDCSRFCVLARLVPRPTSRAVCGAFLGALETHGIPDEVLTDNGRVFTGRYYPRPVEVLFDRICRERGIHHLLTAVRSPTTTGKIERFHRTLRDEFLDGTELTDIASAQEALDRWVDEYNKIRPHQSLHMATPAERFAAATPTPAPIAPPTAPAPRNVRSTGADRGPRVIRLVNSDGRITVGYQRIPVGTYYAGSVVDVELSDRLVEIHLDGQLIKTVLRDTRGEVSHRRIKQSVK